MSAKAAVRLPKDDVADVAPRHRRRYERLFQRLLDWLEPPMVLLGLVWLALLIAEMVVGLRPWISTLAMLIWLLFLLEFILSLTLAPYKLKYLRQNWLTAASLLIPAVRVLRIARAIDLLGRLSAIRGFGLLRLLFSMNRSIRALRKTLARRGFAYILGLSVVLVFAGGAAMYFFERKTMAEAGLGSFADSLWWAAMLLTTFGSGYWPQTPEGRLLTLILGLYGLGIFGYITAALATYLIGRDAEKPDTEIAGAEDVRLLRRELRRLRAELRALRTAGELSETGPENTANTG